MNQGNTQGSSLSYTGANGVVYDQTNWDQLFAQVSVGICILRGLSFVVEFANSEYLSVVDRNATGFVNKPLLEALPELEEQGVIEILENVYHTGVPYNGKEFPAIINKNGDKVVCYFNFVYQPLKGSDGQINGIMVVVSDVTEMVNKRQVLEERERAFRNMVMDSPIAMTILRGEEWIIEMANKILLEKIWKRSLEEVKGKKLLDVFPELEGQKFPKLLRAVAVERKAYRENEAFTLINNGGKLVGYYLDFEYAPLFGIDNEVSGIMATVYDVSEKVHARLHIEHAEERARIALEAGGMEIFDLFFHQRKLICSDSLYKMLGTEGEIQSFEHFRRFLLEEDGTARWSAFKTAMETGWLSLETSISVNGVTKWLRVQGKLEKQNHLPRRITGAVKDITDEKIAIRQLEEKEVRLRLATEGTKLATWDMNLITRDISYSPQLVALMGRNAGDSITHQQLRDGLHPDDIDIVEQRFQEAMISGLYAYEARFVLPDGALRWVRTKGKVMFDDNGNPYRMLGTMMDITDEKAAQTALQESEDRLRIATQSTGLGTFDYDVQAEVLTWDDRCKELFGLKPNEPVSYERTFVEGLHPDDRAATLLAVQQSMDPAGSGTYVAEYRTIDRNGKLLYWIKAKGKTYFDDYGKPFRLVGTVLDITAQKMAVAALAESELLFKTIANVSPVGLWMTNTKVENTFVNNTWGEWTGKGAGNNNSTGWLSSVLKEDQEKVTVLFRKAFNEKTSFSAEFRFVKQDGTIRWGLSTGYPFYDNNNVFGGYAGSVTDITGQKELERELERKVEERTAELDARNNELKESEERYHRMINEVQDYAIILLDEKGIIQNWNKGAEKIKGYTEQEVIGKHFSIFYTLKDRERNAPELLLVTASANGRALIEGWRLRKDNTLFWGSIVITTLYDEHHRVVGFSKVTRDLTEKKITEERLKEKSEDLNRVNIALEKSNSELEQYAYVASHDLQEPLRKISTYSGILKEKIKNNPDPSVQDTVGKIIKSSERMSQLIKDLLDFSRLLDYKKSFVPVSLCETLSGVISDLELNIQQRNAVVKVAEGLPVIEAIPLQVNQLFYNLLNNALKFSKPSIPPQIEINYELLTHDALVAIGLPVSLKHDHVIVSFRDNGIGFNQQYAEQIFEIFKRLYNSQTYAGSGIGLALCKKIVTNHNGHIIAESKEGDGALFKVYLPVKQ